MQRINKKNVLLQTTNKKSLIMKRSITLVSIIMFTLGLSSCQYNKVKELETQNAKLKSEIVKSDESQVQFMNSYAEIEYNLDQIKNKEKLLSKKSVETDINPDVKQKVLDDVIAIGKLMETNRKKLQDMDKLRKQLIKTKRQNKSLIAENRALKSNDPNQNSIPAPTRKENYSKSSSNQNSTNQSLITENKRLNDLSISMDQMIKTLQAKLAESEAKVEQLQEELVLSKEAYAALQTINDSLSNQTETYMEENNKMQSQFGAINDINSSAYYIITTSSDLKDKKVILKGEVNPDANDRMYTKINIDSTRMFPTNSKKIELISKHPVRSYVIDKKDPKNLIIKIKNPEQFWKYTKYLVVKKK